MRGWPTVHDPAPALRRILSLGLSLVFAVACTGPPDDDRDPLRLEKLERAFSIRDSRPEEACDLFAEAGSGPILESARFEAWYAVLKRVDAGPVRWRVFLDARPNGALSGRSTLALAQALVDDGDNESAVATLAGAPDSIRHLADVELIRISDGEIAARAAGRLAREAPNRLRTQSPTLEKSVLREFDHEDWMVRAASWRAAGLGSRGAAELRTQRRSGAQERQRRIELARCELDAGSTTRALNALPAVKDSGAEELVLRAEVHRRRGWGRVPDRSARRSFNDCLDVARKAASDGDGEIRIPALALILECGTESGNLQGALAAWQQLEALSWTDRRRTWLGRRLGVALAESGSDPDGVMGIADALPNHERCLRYWLAAASSDRPVLTDLASVAISDLYGRWARRETGLDLAPDDFTSPPPVGSAAPSSSVAWLLASAGSTEASNEWQRQLARRHPTRSEAVAAASLATEAGQHNTAIRTLRSGFPGISSISISEVPADAALAYLPLRWPGHLMAAARETGVDPWLIAAVARQESTFSAHARSPAGAIGVLQLLPSTARLHSRALGLGSRPDLRDPAVNIRLGARELAWLIRRYGAIEPALAAYNAGESRVRKWWRQWPEPDVFAEAIPIPETYLYVRRVVFLSDAYRQIHSDSWRSTP